METTPFGNKGIVSGVQLSTQSVILFLFFPLFDWQFKVCLAYREIVFCPICIDLTLVHRYKINGYLLIKTWFSVLDSTHLPLKQHHCAVFHPCFHPVRVDSFAFCDLFHGYTPEKRHLHIFATLSFPHEKTFAEVSAKVKFQQCGEILWHGIFIALPLVFAYIFSVLVLYNAATCRKGGFRYGEQFVGVFGHCACGVRLFPAYL